MPSCFLFVLASIISLRTNTYILEWYYNCKFYTHLGFRTLNLRIMGRASFLWTTTAVTFGAVIVDFGFTTEQLEDLPIHFYCESNISLSIYYYELSEMYLTETSKNRQLLLRKNVHRPGIDPGRLRKAGDRLYSSWTVHWDGPATHIFGVWWRGYCIMMHQC